MKKLFLIIALGLVGVNFAFAQGNQMMNDKGKMEMKDKTLYERLGGYDALAAVTDDFLGRLLKDKTFAKFLPAQAMIPRKKFDSTLLIFYVSQRADLVLTQVGQ